MSNNCYFTMRAIGDRESLEEFVKMMSGQGEFGSGRLGRVIEFAPQPVQQEGPKGVYSLEAEGCCANSIYSAMQREGLGELAKALGTTPLLSLEDETERLHLAIEAYSTEMDNGFQEHVVIADGKVLLEEDASIHEYFVEDIIERLDEFNEAYKTSYTPDNLQGKRLITVGGLENHGNFSKLEEIAKTWSLEPEKSLEALMDEASRKAAEKNDRRSEQEKIRKNQEPER